MITAVEAATHGITMGEVAVSGLMFAHDFEGISEAPEIPLVFLTRHHNVLLYLVGNG